MNLRSFAPYWRACALITLLQSAIPPLAFAQRTNDLPTTYLLNDPKFSSIILAAVGPWNVSAQEFLLSYEYGPAFPKRERDSKKRYLTYMIYEKLLALDGYERGLQSSPMVQEVLTEVEADLATEELYKDDVLSTVHVSDKEIELGVSKENVHLGLKWIYSPTEESILHQTKLVREGASFDSLFALQLSDSLSMDNRSMQTTRFTLELKNSALAIAIDSLTTGMVSRPIHAPDGWYLFKIVEGWTSPILKETENNKLREDIRRALVQHKSDSLSDQYVHHMLLEQNPVIIRESFDLLQAHLGKKFLSAEKHAAWALEKKITLQGLNLKPDSVELYRGRVLVMMKDGKFLLGDFLNWYTTRHLYIRLNTKSPRAFFASVEQLVWRMVRDRMLMQRASERGLQNRESVVKQKKWWEEKLVYRAARLEIENSIKEDDVTLHKYYAEHQRDYRNDKENIRFFEEVKDDVSRGAFAYEVTVEVKDDVSRDAFANEVTEEVKDDVSRDAFAYEVTKRLLYQITQLKRKYKVEINDETLKNMYVDIENQPKAIDVYTVKKGGVFPRTAFPSIDYEWQTWE
jgi:hypothetical protein